MKKLLITLFILISGLGCLAATDAGLREYGGIELAKGTFVPVINTQEISTQYCDVGNQFKFVSSSDLYLHETNVIPQNTEFYGYIEKINEPVVGTNASMMIKITKLKFIDGFELPVRGYVFVNNSPVIGGEMTEPETYVKKPSYRQGFKTMVGSAPGPSRKPGEHKVIASGTDLLIVLSAPLYITHTVNN
jgi:hypothetical protein